MDMIEHFNVAIRDAVRRIKVRSKLSPEVERRVSRDRVFGFGTDGVFEMPDGSLHGRWRAAISMDEPPKIHGGPGKYRFFAAPLRIGEPYECGDRDPALGRGWSGPELESIEADALISELQTSFNKFVDFVNSKVG